MKNHYKERSDINSHRILDICILQNLLLLGCLRQIPVLKWVCPFFASRENGILAQWPNVVLAYVIGKISSDFEFTTTTWLKYAQTVISSGQIYQSVRWAMTDWCLCEIIYNGESVSLVKPATYKLIFLSEDSSFFNLSATICRDTNNATHEPIICQAGGARSSFWNNFLSCGCHFEFCIVSKW